MYCQNCGCENKGGAKFCRQCGCKFKQSKGSSGFKVLKHKKFMVCMAIISVLFVGFNFVFYYSNNEVGTPFSIYIKDDGLYLTSVHSNKSVLVDDKIFVDAKIGKGYINYIHLNGIPSGNNNFKFFYDTLENSLIYKSNYEIDFFPGEYQGHVENFGYSIASLNNGIEKKNLSEVLNMNNYTFVSQNHNKIYYLNNDGLYEYGVENNTSKTLFEGAVWNIKYSPNSNRFIIENRNENSNENEIYELQGESEAKIILNKGKIIYSDEDNDVYVCCNDNYIYLVSDGDLIKIGAVKEPIDRVYWCSKNGEIIFTTYSTKNGYYEYKHYYATRNDIEKIDKFSDVSKDGKVLCFLDEDKVLYKYVKDDIEFKKIEKYTDVEDFMITQYGDILTIKDSHGNGVYDLYLNDCKVSNNVYVRTSLGRHLFMNVDIISRDKFTYVTEYEENEKGIGLYTLNLYDGKSTKVIAEQTDDFHVWVSDSAMYYIKDRDESTCKGDLMFFDGEKSKLIDTDIYTVYSPYNLIDN